MRHEHQTLKHKKQYLRIAGGSVGALLIVFVLFNVLPMIRGVQLSVSGIENGRTYNESTLTLSGNAEHAVKLTVNGNELPVTRDGVFEDTIVLLSGYNIITVQAVDKFGNISEKKYEVVEQHTDVAQDDGAIINQS